MHKTTDTIFDCFNNSLSFVKGRKFQILNKLWKIRSLFVKNFSRSSCCWMSEKKPNFMAFVFVISNMNKINRMSFHFKWWASEKATNNVWQWVDVGTCTVPECTNFLVPLHEVPIHTIYSKYTIYLRKWSNFTKWVQVIRRSLGHENNSERSDKTLIFGREKGLERGIRNPDQWKGCSLVVIPDVMTDETVFHQWIRKIIKMRFMNEFWRTWFFYSRYTVPYTKICCTRYLCFIGKYTKNTIHDFQYTNQFTDVWENKTNSKQ